MQWRVLVTLAGVDKSSQLVGEVVIDGEESSAAIAEFTLLPEVGPINPDQWIGAEVLLHSVIDGGAPERIFTGTVDVPKYDIDSGLTKFRCTDGLQKRVEEMSRTEIDDIVWASWSPYVFEDTWDGWQYAQDQASTDYYSLEADRFGVIDVNAMFARDSFSRVYSDSDYLAGSLEVDLPSHRDLVNRVNLSIECRYTLFQEVTGNAGWAWPYKPGDAPGWPVPSPSAAQSAASSAGHLVSFNYQEFPETGLYKEGSWTAASSVDISSGNFVSWRNDRPSESCFSFSSTVAKRAAVEVTFTYYQRIDFTDSIGRYGGSEKEEVFSLDLTASAPAGWEQFQSDVSSPGSFSDNEWLRPDMPVSFDPGLFEKVVEVLIYHHQVDMMKRHRARVRFGVPFDPLIDRSLFARINSSKVTASGKVFRYVHKLNTEDGRAITELTIAPNVCGASGVTYLSGDYAELPDELPVKPDSFNVSVSFQSRDPSESGGVGFQVDADAPDFAPVTFSYPLNNGGPAWATTYLHVKSDELVIHGRS